MSRKPRIRLVHWNEEEARERAARLEALGFAVLVGRIDGPEWARFAKRPDADAVVVDLSRLPSHGRRVGIYLRDTKATRGIPLVFLGGEPEKVAKARAELPHATFAAWRGAKGAIAKALARRGAEPPPAPARAGYSGTPLPQKLGIRPGMRVGLHRAPPEFAQTLGALPEGAALLAEPRTRCDLDLLFCARAAELKRAAALAKRAGSGGLWICWPKKASGVATDASDAKVRAAGLAAGLVDVKVCAVDATWSGLKFLPRRKA